MMELFKRVDLLLVIMELGLYMVYKYVLERLNQLQGQELMVSFGQLIHMVDLVMLQRFNIIKMVVVRILDLEF